MQALLCTDLNGRASPNLFTVVTVLNDLHEPILMEKLEEIFQMQQAYGDLIKAQFVAKNPTLADQIEALAVALIDEAVELHKETPWKWWKKQQTFDLKKIFDESIDVFHFLVAIWSFMGISPEDVVMGYRAKNAINKKRQEQNY